MTCLILLFPFKAVAYEAGQINNIFGIHLAQPHLEDLKTVSELVNSNGGDWGYITLVIEDHDRNIGKWQDIFNKLRSYHLIPIIRLATSPDGDNWRRPKKEDAEPWVNFLNSLNWVTKDRYIILFNEPNHSREWGGEVDPKNYGEVAMTFARKLKEKNADYFVMLAGLDASAPSYRPSLEDEYEFFKEMFSGVSKDDFEKYIDGLSSHSYPNPAFAGSPSAWGKGTIHTYVWELETLAGMGITKKLPVFITETGWSADSLSRGTIAAYFQTAFSEWANDERIVAVTPFVFDYQAAPFLAFSWKQFGSADFYEQYYAVKSMAKKKGVPRQIERGTLTLDLPKELLVNSSYHFQIHLKNEGQAWWDKSNGYHLKLVDYPENNYFFSDLVNIQPGESADVDLFFKTTDKLEEKKIQVLLVKNDQDLVKGPIWIYSTVAPPSISFTTALWPKLKTNGEDFELQVFDTKDNVLFKKTGVIVQNGKGTVEVIQNVALGVRYRIVLLKPYYLPRQQFVVFKKGVNSLTFKKMLPFDFNLDGKADGEDFLTLLRTPGLLRLFGL